MLDRLEDERRESTRRALAAQEAERRRIARELHDEIGQTLTGSMLRSEMRPRRRGRCGPTPRSGDARAERGVRAIPAGCARWRSTTSGSSALHALPRASAGQAGSGRLRLERDPPPPDEAELVVYRVAQEALTNVARHADAPAGRRLTLSRRSGGVTLASKDDGRRHAARRPRGRHRDAGMRERALLVGAALDDRRRDRGAPDHMRMPPRRGRDDDGADDRVLVADDHASCATGCGVLEAEPDFAVVAEAGDGARRSSARPATRSVSRSSTSRCRAHGLQAARRARPARAPPHILMLSMHDNEQYLFEALRARVPRATC